MVNSNLAAQEILWINDTVQFFHEKNKLGWNLFIFSFVVNKKLESSCLINSKIQQNNSGTMDLWCIFFHLRSLYNIACLFLKFLYLMLVRFDPKLIVRGFIIWIYLVFIELFLKKIYIYIYWFFLKKKRYFIIESMKFYYMAHYLRFFYLDF